MRSKTRPSLMSSEESVYLQELRSSLSLGAWLEPGRQGEKLQPFGGPATLLMSVAALIFRRLNREVRMRLTASRAQVQLLTVLDHHGPSTIKVLAGATSIDKAQVSRTMSQLVRAKQATLAGPTSHARRFSSRTKAVITPAGRTFLRRAQALIRRHNMQILRALSPNERRSLYHILQRLIELESRKWR